VPWSRGRDFEPGEEWDPEAFPLPAAVRDALFVNLLTEDNLPYYFHTIDNIFGPGVWGEWIRRWTAEEQRHSIVIRDYLTVTRALDPVELERARMAQVSGAKVPEPQTAAETLVYVALQELATRVSHRNTGKLLGDPVGYEVMARVAADENLHYLFYRDLVAEAIALDPSAVVKAIDAQVREFEMPGTGIHNFAARAASIARAGIYDLALHYDQVLVPVVLRHWKLEEIEGLSAEAEEARDRVLHYMRRLESVARRLAERRGAKDGQLIDA
jgi:acyl-[acyl-carrier-protein] desaturase